MKILWILPKWPYPSMDGATSAHMALLLNWNKNSDASLDIAVFSNEKKSEQDILEFKKAVGFKNLIQLPLTSASKQNLVLTSFFKKDPLPSTVSKFTSPMALAEFQNWSANKEWTHIVFDGLHPAGLFFQDGKFHFPKAKFICTRAHNVETELWEQMTEKSSVPMKWIYQLEEKRMARFEKAFFEICDLIAPVSINDAEKIKKLSPKANIHPTIIGMDWAYTPKKIENKNIELLFIGRLDWYPNYEGLNWFLDEIWPKVLEKRSDIYLSVVGGFASEELTKRLNSTKSCTFHGRVPNVGPFYEKSSLTLIPIWTGSGTRVKAIESAKYARSFIATNKGIEGVILTKGVDYIEENDKNKWIEFLLNVTTETCQLLGEQLHKSAQETFDQSHIQRKFLIELDHLGNKNGQT